MRLFRMVPALAGALFSCLAAQSAAEVRPVYVIVHRVNDLSDISDAIEHGGNAIEIDLQLCRDNKVWEVNHDNCGGSTTVEAWLDEFVGTSGNSAIAAIFFDIKENADNVSTEVAQGLVDAARTRLPDDLLTVYGVGDWDNRATLEKIMGSLRPNEAVTIDFSDGASAMQKINFFTENGVDNQVFADGISAALSTPDSVFVNLALARLNLLTLKQVKFVYSWTYEAESSIEKVLIDYSADGVMVNDCAVIACAMAFGDDGLDNALDVIEDHSDKIRLATRADITRWGFVDSTSR